MKLTIHRQLCRNHLLKKQLPFNTLSFTIKAFKTTLIIIAITIKVKFQANHHFKKIAKLANLISHPKNKTNQINQIN